MPINIANDLPAKAILEEENIFSIEAEKAHTQDIRPLKIIVLNLMPKKIETETQLLRLLSKSPLQIDVDFLKVSNHESKNTSEKHLIKFYDYFSEIKNNYYDGMIITGAPVEHLEFRDVDYWRELCAIMEWSKSNVFSTMHICWAAQAGLNYHYGIEKKLRSQKLFGIYPQELYKHNFCVSGFDEIFNMPQSRHTQIDEEALKKVDNLIIMAGSKKTGSNLIVSNNMRQIFVMGHLEYTRMTLAQEYFRDKEAGKNIECPFNYFKDNMIDEKPIWIWKAHANLLYRNWLNYIYQMTPYEISEIANIDE